MKNSIEIKSQFQNSSANKTALLGPFTPSPPPLPIPVGNRRRWTGWLASLRKWASKPSIFFSRGVLESTLEFWRKNPAALIGISLLIGMNSFLWMIPWGIYLLWLKKKEAFLLMFTAAAYVFFLYSEPPLPKIGYFAISSVQPYRSPFQRGMVYQGTLYTEGTKVQCLAKSGEENRSPANCNYVLQGKFQKIDPFHYVFKSGSWTPVPNSFNLAEFRFSLKETLKEFLEKKLTRPRTATFLGSLLTGDVEDRLLRHEFGRVGLQHILAISGFHFAVLISFCTYFLSLFCSPRVKDSILMGAIFAYFLFVGNLPAVQRSALVAGLYLLGKLLGRHATGINLLGVALIVETIADPLIIANLGFQLSFLSCVGILLFRPLFSVDRFFSLPESPHARLLTHYFREALGITLSVNAAILPLLLYHFHTFPLLSLLYNLFFPFLVSFALFSLLFALTISVILPMIAAPFFAFTDFLTAQLLDIAAYPPSALDYSLQASWVTSWMIPPYLFLLFYLTNRFASDKIFSFSGGRSSVG